jgi:hypothetical protein
MLIPNSYILQDKNRCQNVHTKLSTRRNASHERCDINEIENCGAWITMNP